MPLRRFDPDSSSVSLPTYFGSERKLAVHVIGAMERRETTANEHWTVKAVFAFVLACLVPRR
jgi:hypothetical protein